MRDDQDIDDLLTTWGREECGDEGRGFENLSTTEGLLREGLAFQARRRHLRQLVFGGVGIVLLALSFLGGRMSATPARSLTEAGTQHDASSPADGSAEPDRAEPEQWPQAMRYELEAYEKTGAERRDAYARAAEAWIEEESDVLESLRCIEHLTASGEELAESDPLRNHWLYRALQRDMN